MNVLVYSGPEVLQTSLKNTLSTLRSVLIPHYTVQTISQESLASQPWSAGCALLVFPGCRELSPSPFVTIIRRYVEDGGAFLALSAGATYSSSSRVLDLDSMGISGLSKDQTLRFYDKATSSYLYPTFHPRGKIATSSVTLNLTSGKTLDSVQWSEAVGFVGIDGAKNIKILAHIGERVAAVRYELSKGTVIVWAPSVELLRSTESEDPATASWETNRLSIMREILRDLGLRVPSENPASTCHPLPQFLTANPSKPEIVSQIMKALSESMGPVEDKNDTFHFCNLGGNDALLKDSTRSGCGIQSDPSSWQPKHIIVCRDGRLPSSQQTPLFNLNDYFRELSRARDINGLHEDTNPWAMGEALFYSEVVTSTQTMFDKNPTFTSLLPSPILSLASQQLTGRGRGTNVWLSPSGCLTFSLLLRTSLAILPASKLVFVQYLFGLAVVEACRQEAILGPLGEKVRLKWPNDLYAVFGSGDTYGKKIGGILVNTIFTGSKVEIVIGCGLNVSNPPPIASLTQLLPRESELQLSMERTTATIMAKFESMWSIFVSQRGSFEPFMRLYLERWLHSDQLVTLTTTNPPKAVRITGITPDHGLLRTVPERTGWSSGEEGFIDLQPDGNSFDIMAGLIKSKT